MVYDWEDKQKLCYRMYIEENKSLEDIMEYMKEELNKRAFQTQFKRWNFPSKQHPAHKNAALVQRVKELWDVNTSQREMLRILNEEGYDIKERELMRVRGKNRWLLREANGNQAKKRDSDNILVDQLSQALYPDAQMEDAEGEDEAEPEADEPMEDMTIVAPRSKSRRADSPPLSPEVLAKRQERLEKLQAESAERWATRKRRRRTRGWAGLPADPPGPPRFPSETTIDESKAFLNLDSHLYKDIRTRFQRICEEADIIKKTIAGPERWEAAKDRLIQESEHLQSVFWTPDESHEAKKLALDVVCSDVTKRMRTLERRMTIAEAKNALGINPEESRQLRNAFYQVLKADHFTSKLEAGEEHWKELKAQWIANSTLLQQILAPGDADPKHAVKVKAMEVLCRDVMKRLRDDQTKRDPTRKKKYDTKITAAEQPSPTDNMNPYEESHDQHDQDENSFHASTHAALIQAASQAQAASIPIATSIPPSIPPSMAPPRALAGLQRAQGHIRPQPLSHPAQHNQNLVDHNSMQIDPSLLLAAANDPGLMNRGGMQNHSMPNQFSDYSEPQFVAQAAQQTYHAPASIPFYFRLHPASDVRTSAPIWLSGLSSVSVDELRQLATAKFPGTIALRIEGIIKQPNGQESTILIDQDDELGAYFAAGGVKPTFAVQLVNAWKD